MHNLWNFHILFFLWEICKLDFLGSDMLKEFDFQGNNLPAEDHCLKEVYSWRQMYGSLDFRVWETARVSEKECRGYIISGIGVKKGICMSKEENKNFPGGGGQANWKVRSTRSAYLGSEIRGSGDFSGCSHHHLVVNRWGCFFLPTHWCAPFLLLSLPIWLEASKKFWMPW